MARGGDSRVSSVGLTLKETCARRARLRGGAVGWPVRAGLKLLELAGLLVEIEFNGPDLLLRF